MIASTAGAASLGRLVVLSAICEPLRAEIEVSVSPEELETATARLASPDAYPPAGLQYNAALNGARAVIRYRHNGRYVVDIVTTRPVNEPVLLLLVELEVRGSRLMRVYNLLLVPQGGGAAPAAVAPVAAPVAVPAVAAPVAHAPPKSARAAPRAQRPAAPVQAAASSPEPDREIQRLEAQLQAQAKTLAGMLDRVAVMEREVAQLQKAFAALDRVAAAPISEAPKPAAVPPQPSAVVATAPPAAAPTKPAVTVTPPQVREPAPAPAESRPRPRSWTDALFDNALLVMAGMLLVMVIVLVYWTWGRRPASDAKAPPEAPPEAEA